MRRYCVYGTYWVLRVVLCLRHVLKVKGCTAFTTRTGKYILSYNTELASVVLTYIGSGTRTVTDGVCAEAAGKESGKGFFVLSSTFK